MTGARTQRTGARDRGQAFTLEAVVAAIVLLGALLFALEVSGVTSLSASTSSGQVLDQQERVAGGALDAAIANGSVKSTLLYWNESAGTFHDPDEDGYYTVGPPTAFGATLNDSLGGATLAFNVEVRYLDENGSVARKRLVRNGEPSDDAVRVVRTVTLYDDDRLRDANGTVTATRLDESSLYVPDRYPDDPVYNVVSVEVVAWPV